MSRRSRRGLIYTALLLAFLLRNDLWLWRDGSIRFGLPAGLAYHVGFCLVAALLMALLVRYAWPEDLESDGE